MADEMPSYQGLPISFDFFLGLGCARVTEDILKATNITAVYERYAQELPYTDSSLWKKGDDGGCFEALCRSLQGGGNPDISGIGVIVAYALEVVLAVFLSAALIQAFRGTGKREIPETSVKTRALAETVAVFADTALFFALAIVLATCILNNPAYQRTNSISYYDMMQAALASTTTVAPCVAVLFALHCCGEKIGRQICILGLTCFINVAAVVIPDVVRSVSEKQSGRGYGIGDPQANAIAMTEIHGAASGDYYYRIGDYWRAQCYEKLYEQRGIIQVGYYLGVAIGLLGQIMLLGFVMLMGLATARHRAKEFWHWMMSFRKTYSGTPPTPPTRRTMQMKGDQAKGKHRPGIIEIFAFMFVPLAISVWTGCSLLGQRILLTRSWKGEDETQWGFGQMVAVLIFLPVILEFFYKWHDFKHPDKDRPASSPHMADEEEGRAGSSMTDDKGGHVDEVVRPTAARTSSEINPAARP